MEHTTVTKFPYVKMEYEFLFSPFLKIIIKPLFNRNHKITIKLF